MMNPRLVPVPVLVLQVSIGNPEKMEPITNVSQIPSNRWALICCLCKEKTGACIQVSRRSRRHAVTPSRVPQEVKLGSVAIMFVQDVAVKQSS